MNDEMILFEDIPVRKEWDKENEKWWFSVVDVVGVLTDQPDRLSAGNYWRKLKQRLKKEGCQSVTNCHELKLTASDGKKYLTDVADIEQLLRIIQSVPSKKAEPVKQWLAKVGSERIDESINPELAVERIIDTYRKKGYPDEWILQRMKSTDARNEWTGEWIKGGIKDKEFTILTNIMTKVWSGKEVSEYKNHKGLKTKDNLRDHMTTSELAINSLAEIATTEIAKADKPYGLVDNKKVAIEGADIAREARER